MARIFYYTNTGNIYGVHPGEFSGTLPEGVDFIDVPEQSHEIVWPSPAGPGSERTAKVSGGVLVARNDTPVPAHVTKLQLVRSLRSNGHWGATKQFLSSSASVQTKDDWEAAARMDRIDPVVAELTSELGLTEEEMDNVFRAANQL